MNNLKKIIVIICIIVVLIIAFLVIININKEDPYLDSGRNTDFENKITIDISNTIKPIDNRNEFFAVKSCVTKYLSYTSMEDTEVIYSLLDKNYIEERNVTKDNILDKIKKYNSPVFYNDKIYVIQDTYNVYTYFVYGKLIDKQNGNIENFNIIVRLDKANDIFSIIPYEYIENKNYNIEIGNTITFKYNEIENKEYNIFAFENITNEEMAIYYMNEIKDNFIYDSKELFNKLDETYRNKRFLNIEDYNKYVTKNITSIYSSKVSKYQVKQYEKYKQYVCIDEQNRYYVINEIHPGEYTLILDTYTIALPEYIEQYTQAGEKEKVANCINRFIKILNDENYTLAYSFLADSYKNNYFKTQQEFENYAKQNLIGKNKIDFKIFKNEGDIYYTYNVELSKEQNENENIEKTFIVKLNEGTDFELSFNVN